MKKAILFLTLILQTSCQWLLTHPEEDAEAALLIEQAAENLYEYETRTLSPAPPPGIPPMKPIGPTGPGAR